MSLRLCSKPTQLCYDTFNYHPELLQHADYIDAIVIPLACVFKPNQAFVWDHPRLLRAKIKNTNALSEKFMITYNHTCLHNDLIVFGAIHIGMISYNLLKMMLF